MTISNFLDWMLNEQLRLYYTYLSLLLTSILRFVEIWHLLESSYMLIVAVAVVVVVVKLKVAVVVVVLVEEVEVFEVLEMFEVSSGVQLEIVKNQTVRETTDEITINNRHEYSNLFTPRSSLSNSYYFEVALNVWPSEDLFEGTDGI